MRIGELARRSGVATSTLRYYEDAGLLSRPAREANGYRSYAPETADRVRFIKRAQAAGLTLDQIDEILRVRDSGRAPCDRVAQLVADRLAVIDRHLAELAATRAQLAALQERAERLDETECSGDTVCQIIPLEVAGRQS